MRLTAKASTGSEPSAASPRLNPLARLLPLLVLAGVIAALSLAPHGAPQDRAVAAAILIGFAILSWALGLIAEPATSLLFFLLGVTFHVARPEVIFSGFASPASGEFHEQLKREFTARIEKLLAQKVASGDAPRSGAL